MVKSVLLIKCVVAAFEVQTPCFGVSSVLVGSEIKQKRYIYIYIYIYIYKLDRSCEK